MFVLVHMPFFFNFFESAQVAKESPIVFESQELLIKLIKPENIHYVFFFKAYI